MATSRKCNKKLAVLAGCNYPNTPYELRGCVNDVIAMKEVLETIYGFEGGDMEILIDVAVPGTPCSLMPTGANIKAALYNMVQKAQAGDVMFFHFSGHGTYDYTANNVKEEAIVPSDFNLIYEMDFKKLIMEIAERSCLTFLSDSCFSGGLVDGVKEQIGPDLRSVTIPPAKSKARFISIENIKRYLQSFSRVNYGAIDQKLQIGSILMDIFKEDASVKFQVRPEPHPRSLNGNEAILLCACQANELSYEVLGNDGKPHGAFTAAVVKIVKDSEKQGHENISNKNVVMEARNILEDLQHPCLYCTDLNVNLPFLGGA